MFSMQLEPHGVVRLTGRLDASEADRAIDGLDAITGPVTLDCSNLEYISSAGLSVMLVTHRRLRAAGHALRLTNLQPRVRNVFTYAGLHRVLQIE
ncbi:MAG: STAS domain-containing protein [Candidatus Eisenbacteria bacterium]|uniref:Anti-sigma factor antagonist n=1 Tax=Eiseniibacteriota bacterium TaxID=2212470 RepID=A0A538SWY1_UNCEI|nr:MAG: STAS domain-containing protein [Candidatus Eisenbacteria bacterium]